MGAFPSCSGRAHAAAPPPAGSAQRFAWQGHATGGVQHAGTGVAAATGHPGPSLHHGGLQQRRMARHLHTRHVALLRQPIHFMPYPTLPTLLPTLAPQVADAASSRLLGPVAPAEGSSSVLQAALQPLLLASTFAYLLAKQNLVFVGQLSYSSHTVFGYQQQASSLHRLMLEHGQAVVAAVRSALRQVAAAGGKAPCMQLAGGAPAQTAALLPVVPRAGAGSALPTHPTHLAAMAASLGSWRVALAVAAASQAMQPQLQQLLGSAANSSAAAATPLQDGATAAWLARLWVAHAALLQGLRLADRALPALGSCGEGGSQLESSLLHPFACSVLRQVEPLLAAAYTAAAAAGECRGQGAEAAGSQGPRQEDRGTGAAAAAGISPALAELADGWDTRLFSFMAVLLLHGAAEGPGTASAAGPLLEGLSREGLARLQAALAALTAGQAGAPCAAQLAGVTPGQQQEWGAASVAALLQPPASCISQCRAAAAAALAAAGQHRQRHAAQLEAQVEAAAEQQAALARLHGSCSLVAALRSSVAPVAGQDSGCSLVGSSAASSAAACPAAQAAEAAASEQLEPIPAAGPQAGAVGVSRLLLAGSMARFGIDRWNERYHWHVQPNLKPFFLLEVSLASFCIFCPASVFVGSPGSQVSWAVGR